MVCTMRAINMYIHCSDMYLHVYTFTYKFCNIQTCTYNVQTCICRVCVADVQCTDGYVQIMKCTYIIEQCTYTDISFWMQLFDSPGWLACRLGLAAAWSLFKFKHTSLIGISLRPYTSYNPVQPPFRQGWGQVQKQQAPCSRRGQQPLPRLWQALRRRRQARQLLQQRPHFAGVLVWCCSSILLVL